MSKNDQYHVQDCLNILQTIWDNYSTWRLFDQATIKVFAEKFACSYRGIEDYKNQELVWIKLFQHGRFCADVCDVLNRLGGQNE